MNKITCCKSFTVLLKSGKPFTAEMEAVWAYDANADCDADGLRGIPEFYIDELCFTVDPSDDEWNLDDNGEPVTAEEKKEAEELLIAKAEDDSWDEVFDSREREEY